MSPELADQIRMATLGIQTTSISKLVEEYLSYTEQRLSLNTLPARKSRLRKFSEFMKLAGITDISELNNAVLAVYFQQLQPNNKATSRNADRTAIKSFLSWVEDYKEIKVLVRAAGVKPEKIPIRIPRYLLAEVIEGHVIYSMEVAYIDRLIVACAFKLGLRVSELANLRLRDFDSDVMRVIGKGDKERMVVIPAMLSDMIKQYVEISPYPIGDDDFIFQSYWRDGWQKMTAKTIWSRVKTVFKRQCDLDVSPQWMRRSYAVDLLLRGCDIITVQKSLGHADLKVTQIYAELTDDIIKKQVHKYLG